MSETIPGDEDRGGDEGVADIDLTTPGGDSDGNEDDDDEPGGTGADDGGPGSHNM